VTQEADAAARSMGEGDRQRWRMWAELLAAPSLTMRRSRRFVAERTAAKKARNFARADQIRNELAEKGVVIAGLEGWGAVEAEVSEAALSC